MRRPSTRVRADQPRSKRPFTLSTPFRGLFGPDSIPKTQPTSNGSPYDKLKGQLESLRSRISVNNFEKVVKQYLSPAGWPDSSPGADDKRSRYEAARASCKLTLRSRVLRIADHIDVRITILGKEHLACRSAFRSRGWAGNHVRTHNARSFLELETQV
ncbi:uncharacterized protein PV07_12804 [Cladophialophora immunda]|uniref:Uncharacterized protein n=1 Tax=Cladophialophora immunda TaxID=569365 RepID=A0A0D2BRR8_9EURO|nr:uncharacterized protein PV07_12804 [Cladophialophora immunda]KIW21768.1 hypothetical protein PV07_12804 [Cladophialophora immunda]